MRSFAWISTTKFDNFFKQEIISSISNLSLAIILKPENLIVDKLIITGIVRFGLMLFIMMPNLQCEECLTLTRHIA